MMSSGPAIGITVRTVTDEGMIRGETRQNWRGSCHGQANGSFEKIRVSQQAGDPGGESFSILSAVALSEII